MIKNTGATYPYLVNQPYFDLIYKYNTVQDNRRLP